MPDEIDLLKIKINKARESLPKETLVAIEAVDWRAAILSLREKKGYSFEQLGDLETETELLMCGLLPPADYPKELETRMHISRAEANELVNTMNDLVFRKIKNEMIKNSEDKKLLDPASSRAREDVASPADRGAAATNRASETRKLDLNQPEIEPPKSSIDSVMKSAGIEVISNKVAPAPNAADTIGESREDILKKVEQPAPVPKITPIQILGEKFTGNVQTKVTETEHSSSTTPEKSIESKPKIDPYREIPE